MISICLFVIAFYFTIELWLDMGNAIIDMTLQCAKYFKLKELRKQPKQGDHLAFVISLYSAFLLWGQ